MRKIEENYQRTTDDQQLFDKTLLAKIVAIR